MFAPARILHPTDFSGCAAQALDHAVALARRFDAVLHVLHVLPSGSKAVSDRPARTPLRQTLDRLEALLAARATSGLRAACTVASESDAASAGAVVLEFAATHAIDLVVMGTRARPRWRQLLARGTADFVLHHAPCPVLTVHERTPPPPAHPVRRILMPTDFSAASRNAFVLARDLAASTGARLHVLHVVEAPPPPGAYGLAAYLGPELPDTIEHRARGHVETLLAIADPERPAVEMHVICGHVPTTITAFAARHAIDVIVMASHQWSGIERLLYGGTTTRVMHRAPCPVLVAAGQTAERPALAHDAFPDVVHRDAGPHVHPRPGT